MPASYGQMVSYVDCLVDTATTLMLPPARPHSLKVHVEEIREYVTAKTKRDIFRDNEMANDELLAYIRRNYAGDRSLQRLVDYAVENDLPNGFGTGLLDTIAMELIPKEKLLIMKRSTAVTGQCSMDDSPRRHARNIAILASQTHQWPVFIKAHLNIMNDYFDRMSDGSYAQPGRKTYLKELEVLNINTVNLLVGSVLRAGNAAKGHYWGDVNRCGRALAETKHGAAFETKIKEMLMDERLDAFNRSILFLLYSSYCYHQPTREKMSEKIAEMQQEANRYPAFLQAGIRSLDGNRGLLY